MASSNLTVIRTTASSFTAEFTPDLVLQDAPDNPKSRWTGDFLKTDPRLRGQPEWIKLELERPAIVSELPALHSLPPQINSILPSKLVKSTAPHPCNIDQFKVYGSMDDDTEDMTLLLQSSLKNDEIPQTFTLKHTTNDGVVFPCKFIKIVPVTPFNQTYNMSIWYVSLRGVDSPQVVEKAVDDYSNFRDSVALRLILKYLRRTNSKAYPALLEETGLLIEHPLISELYECFVVQGDHERAEAIMEECATAGLVDLRMSTASARHTTSWKRIWDTSNGHSDAPPPPQSALRIQTGSGSADVEPTPNPTLSSLSSSRAADGLIPSPRGGHVCALDQARGVMYLFGGWDGTQDLADFWAYSIPDSRWTRLSADVSQEEGPSARACGAAIFDEATGYIYFLGRYVVRMSSTERRRMAAASAVALDSHGGDSGSGAETETPTATRPSGSSRRGTSRTTSVPDPNPGDWGEAPSWLVGLDSMPEPSDRRSINSISASEWFRRRYTATEPEGEERMMGDGFGFLSASLPGSGTSGAANPSHQSFGPKSDFYRYATRGPNEGKWERLSQDTRAEGGIELTNDLALAMDSENQILYAFGGQIYSSRRDNTKHYGSCCSYEIQSGLWLKLFKDATPAKHRSIPSRSGHSMFYDPPTKCLYVLGGDRSGHAFDTIWTYDTQNCNVSEMALPAADPKPSALQMTRATADTAAREIYCISELAGSSTTRVIDGNSEQMISTLWVYNMDSNAWSHIIEPTRPHPHPPPSLSGDEKENEYDTFEPRPRLGHTVVFDSSRQMFLMFGGNSGGKTRLNDFWSLSLNRPSITDALRKGKLSIRSQRYKEMCETEPSLVALQYLQLEVSAAVDHNDEDESASFQRLLSLLLSRPMSPTSPTASMQIPLPHPTDNPADIDMRIDEVHANGGIAGESESHASKISPELHAQRMEAFEQLLAFIDPRAKQPKADIMDLVRSEL
ncbi:hypothetical protein DL93DRAFT_2152600 [Clavulina sp. PMI_390]|nr:hypothetical protein DL93DRAFT_2152600 [Clavulina sp. PMI_390]